jgi:cation diffusion facilitator family transporter
MTERIGLLISNGGNVIIGVVGVTIALISDSQAILLDGLFNLTYFLTGLFAIKVAGLVQRGDDERFPAGYSFFEPLINGIKGLMVLGVSVMALIGALDALFSGGRAISPGLATVYGLFAASTCWALALATHRGAVKSGSPLLKADAENWLVNGAISLAVLMAFISIYLVRNTRFAGFIPYIDPLLVLTVVVISISVPVRMAWQSLMELLNRAPSKEITRQVEEIVACGISTLPVQELFVRVLQPGRTRMVAAHVVLPSEFRVNSLSELDNIRAKVLKDLQQGHPLTVMDLIFTSDRFWGAPAVQSQLHKPNPYVQ